MSSLIGKFIVIEGLEGAGKSSAITTVVEQLTKLQIKWITVREPGGTDIGEVLRSIIKNPEYKEILDDKSELLLLYAARIQLIEQKIKPALQQGSWVVADRFELSTFAYQGGGRGLDQGMINNLSAFCLNGFKPDLTLFLDINPETGMQRARSRGTLDRIEQQPDAFFCRVYDAYMKSIKMNSDIRIINANLQLLEVQQSIQQVVNQFIESLR